MARITIEEKTACWIIRAALVVVSACIYGQVFEFDFVNYDDGDYLSLNLFVQQGFAWDGIRWAFTTLHASNWHPITWLSYQIDITLFGLNPGAHHLVNVALHMANALLLFELLRVMTKEVAKAACVAVLFAVHPVHVESVAWIAERKDVLSTFFWFLTTGAYVRYTRQPGIGRYVPVMILFAIGLMTKPMLVTLPFTFLLLDYWPLMRWDRSTPQDGAGSIRSGHLVMEKVPLLALAVASCVVTFWVQQVGGSVIPLDELPVLPRMENAAVSLLSYVRMAFWPANLCVFYPHPGTALSHAGVMGAVLAVAAITSACLWFARRIPYLTVGWLWYLVTLMPVIGLVQVGQQAMADRYLYVPSVGLFIICVWGSADIARRFAVPRAVLGPAGVIAVAVLMTLATRQVGYWRNSQTLWRHASDVIPTAKTPYIQLGNALSAEGRMQEAEGMYYRALVVVPEDTEALTNIASLRVTEGRYAEAISLLKRVLSKRPGDVLANLNMGVALVSQSRSGEAVNFFESALKTQPHNREVLVNLGAALREQGRYDDALVKLAEALRLNPFDIDNELELAACLCDMGRYEEARGHVASVLNRKPDLKRAQVLEKRVREKSLES